ncbi:MAG: thiamine pyrophosphate-dependent dehydrogenase E1 component subunit alpha [Pirellulales bacterium]|nr:thiamine pyrophosphate-dependent dehydrogenase E1 component subunit alpha [Pirellulales bacterium]
MLLERLYRSLYLIRRVEEEVARVYSSDVILSPIHLSIGQEAISVAVCQALAADDVVFGSYRSHALYLAKGGDLRGMLAELYGKATGVAKGKAGSMHLLDTSVHMMGSSAVVGTTIPHAVGYALALAMRGEPRVVVSFFGEGAVEEGVFAESLNYAALKRLPVLFVCENNGYAIHTPQQARQALPDVCAKAESLGVAAECFAELDAERLYHRTSEVVAELRSGARGPVLFECHCYRWREHVGPAEDFAIGYRPRSEAEPWLAGDSLACLARKLDPTQRDAIEQQVERQIADAFRYAQDSPWPGAEELYTDLFA